MSNDVKEWVTRQQKRMLMYGIGIALHTSLFDFVITCTFFNTCIEMKGDTSGAVSSSLWKCDLFVWICWICLPDLKFYNSHLRHWIPSLWRHQPVSWRSNGSNHARYPTDPTFNATIVQEFGLQSIARAFWPHSPWWKRIQSSWAEKKLPGKHVSHLAGISHSQAYSLMRRNRKCGLHFGF